MAVKKYNPEKEDTETETMKSYSFLVKKHQRDAFETERLKAHKIQKDRRFWRLFPLSTVLADQEKRKWEDEGKSKGLFQKYASSNTLKSSYYHSKNSCEKTKFNLFSVNNLILNVIKRPLN